MANRHYEHAIHGLPCRVSTTAHTIYQIICHRYDDRIKLKNGKPNPGYLKSYPGMGLFMSATGRSRQACNTAIESLITNGLIVRVTIGKPGSRAEYLPIYTLNALGESVKNALHVSKVYKSRKVADNVKTTDSMSKDNLPNESSALNTISTISNYKYDKYDKLMTLLPTDISKYIKPGKNLEHLLDKLVDQGMTLEAISAHLRAQKYSDRWTIGGTVVTHLEALCGVKRPRGDEWCGRCDESTRQYLESSPGIDGRDTYECPKCHPNQIRITHRLKGGDLDALMAKLSKYDLDKALDSFKGWKLPD
jgi:hypothetical protein